MEEKIKKLEANNDIAGLKEMKAEAEVNFDGGTVGVVEKAIKRLDDAIRNNTKPTETPEWQKEVAGEVLNEVTGSFDEQIAEKSQQIIEVKNQAKNDVLGIENDGDGILNIKEKKETDEAFKKYEGDLRSLPEQLIKSLESKKSLLERKKLEVLESENKRREYDESSSEANAYREAMNNLSDKFAELEFFFSSETQKISSFDDKKIINIAKKMENEEKDYLHEKYKNDPERLAEERDSLKKEFENIEVSRIKDKLKGFEGECPITKYFGGSNEYQLENFDKDRLDRPHQIKMATIMTGNYQFLLTSSFEKTINNMALEISEAEKDFLEKSKEYNNIKNTIQKVILELRREINYISRYIKEELSNHIKNVSKQFIKNNPNLSQIERSYIEEEILEVLIKKYS